jgi:hypothetical protein
MRNEACRYYVEVNDLGDGQSEPRNRLVVTNFSRRENDGSRQEQVERALLTPKVHLTMRLMRSGKLNGQRVEELPLARISCATFDAYIIESRAMSAGALETE